MNQLYQTDNFKSITLPLFLFVLFLFPNAEVQAQISRSEYIRTYQHLAIEEMGRSGIPASIKMAQAILESGDGNSELARKSNNHFGIKCKSGWSGKKVYYDDDERGECFRKYKSVQESFIDHTNFLMTSPRYAFLFKLSPNDYKGWAKGLKQAGYATARHYDNTLIRIIEDNQLYRLDSKQTFNPLTAQGLKDGMVNPDGLTINPFYQRKVININNLDAVIASPGDTYEILAQGLNMEPWELYKFNDQPQGYKPKANEVVYIESKNRRAKRKTKFHTAETGETMHYISQRYGIKLKPLYRRNRMKKGEQPDPGDIIYLRNKRPKE